jgi:proteasome lid subunit RPN8/RPN11
LPDRSRPPLVAPARVLVELQEHARETHPEECCGLVLGSAPEQLERVVRCRNEMTRLHQQDAVRFPRDGRQAFHMNEVDMLTAQREADASGKRVTAIYHSHADAGPYFSTLDQEFAEQPGFPFPEAIHIVVSVLEGLVNEIAVFRRVPEPPRFEGRLVAGEAP